MSKRMLVTYFSATGTTREVAERLAHAIGADLQEIEPAEPYTAADLDWRDSDSRTSVEHRDRDMRPEMRTPIDVNGYDVVFVGYPLWWETAPRVVRTFLESEDWTDKTIVTFATSGSSTRGADGVQLHDSAPAALLGEILEHNPANGPLFASMRAFITERSRDLMRTCVDRDRHSLPAELVADHYANTLMLVLDWTYLRGHALTRPEMHDYAHALLGNGGSAVSSSTYRAPEDMSAQ